MGKLSCKASCVRKTVPTQQSVKHFESETNKNHRITKEACGRDAALKSLKGSEKVQKKKHFNTT